MTDLQIPRVFDRRAVRLHAARARPSLLSHSALAESTAIELDERVSDVARPFEATLDLSQAPFLKHVGCVSRKELDFDDESLPFAEKTFDLIVSNLAFHWINDVPGALVQIRATLKDNGLFLAALIGEQSLPELRSCLIDSELKMSGGISPRLSPTIDTLTASQLMQRAGFTLPVVDKESITMIFSDMFSLMHELRSMGQTNAHKDRLKHASRRDIFFEAARLYQERYGDTDGHIRATFDVIYLHGWK